MAPKMVDPETQVNEVKVSKKEVALEDSMYTEIKGLPSQMKLYPTNTKIEARPFKVLEVKRLSTMTEENADAIINDVLRRTIRGIKIEDLLIADKMYIIFWLRANTYRESGFGIDYVCSECSQESAFDFTLDKLKVQNLSEDFSPEKTFVNLRKSGDKIKFHLPTIADERKTNRFKIAYSNIIKDLDEEFINFSVMIDSINDENKETIEIYNYLIDIDPEDFAYLRTEMEKFDCGIKSYLEVKCDKCGGVGPVGISFREDFFLPKFKAN